MAEIQPNGIEEGLPNLATLVKEHRETDKHVLFLHGGAVLAPSILSTIDRGSHMISLLNMLEPDVMAVAKSDFAHKEDELTLRSVEASFPLVNSNIQDPLVDNVIEGLYPYELLDVGDYRIGILSLVDPEVVVDYMPKRAQLLDSEEVLKETTSIIRTQGADVIILMADFQMQNIDDLLENSTIDIALISDPDLNPPLKQQKENYYELNLHSGVACRYNIELEGYGSELIVKARSTTLALSKYQDDIEVATKIESYLGQLSDILTTVIGKTLTPIDTRRDAVRTGENSFGNMIADIFRKFYGADFALVNGGGIRGNRQYPPGSLLTRGDIHRELPFNNRLVNLKITGRQLLTSLENGLSRIEDGKGRFPHVSGMVVKYNPQKPKHNRVVEVIVRGNPLQLDATYTLATHDFIASGGDGYVALKDCEKIIKPKGGRLLWEYVRNGIADMGEISPKIDGRMQVLSGN